MRVAVAAPLDAIDQVLALDVARRGTAAFFLPGAAMAAALALRRARRVLIVTGFCVPPGVPETDGPPGAAVLGRALGALGTRVRYVTDPAVVPSLRAALTVLGEPKDILVYPGGGDARRLLALERPTHLVAIERPGRGRAGDYLSARGESVRAWNRPIDELFIRARSIGRPVTVAVGDGGNEIGMGNVHARLARQNATMARIASVVRADHLVVAGTSNWGAYGVVAALQRLARRPLLHTPALERRLLEACVAAGAVDGLLRHRRPTVDGLPRAIHAAVVELLGLAAGPLRQSGALGPAAGSSIMKAR
jgi:hypothetical protein